MFREICGILVFAFLIHGGHGQQFTLPSGILKCSFPDGACFKRQMQSILEVLRDDPSLLHVKDVQPLLVDEWSISPGNVLNFDEEYENIKLYNHHFNKIIHADILNADSPNFIIYFENTELAFVADYEFKNASYQGISLTSKGVMVYREQGVNGYVNISTSLVKRNDKRHIVINAITVFRNPSRVVFEVATGEALRDVRVTNVLNNNWAAVVADAGDSINNLYSVFYEQIMQPVFDIFPYEELFLVL